MAVVRTVLPRKGIIQPQHGASYETDLDTNWQTLDNLLQDATDVTNAVVAAGTVQSLLSDLGISGVVSGFALSTSATLTPGLATGVLYAQGKRYAPATPAPGAAPAPVAPATSLVSYLFYNSTTGFYYQASAVAATSGDALIGQVTTSSTAVTAVTQATRIFSQVAVIGVPAAGGNFSLAHLLGRTPAGAVIQMTSSGTIWFQSPILYDSVNLYLAASDAKVTGKVLIW